MHSDDGRVTARFSATCTDVGFTAPPVPVRVRLLTRPGSGNLYVQVPPEATHGAITDWLAPTGPQAVEFGAHRVQRFDYAPFPEPWAGLYSGLAVDMLWLTPVGEARVSVTGNRRVLQDFASRVKRSNASVEVRHIGPTPARAPLLTDAQDEALRTAVSLGYYRIPRPLNLHDLADKFGVTAASLSERLRRAEGRILTRYVEGTLALDERTPYGAAPPWPGAEPEWTSEEIL